jgi:hypothetical protein
MQVSGVASWLAGIALIRMVYKMKRYARRLCSLHVL